jgi:hypothetical protein
MQKETMHKVKGEKMNCLAECDKNVRILPTIRLNDEDLPEIKDWKVGDKYTLVIDVEQTSMRQGNEWEGSTGNKDKRIHATFKITKVGVEEPAEEPYESEYARRMGPKKS